MNRISKFVASAAVAVAMSAIGLSAASADTPTTEVVAWVMPSPDSVSNAFAVPQIDPQVVSDLNWTPPCGDTLYQLDRYTTAGATALLAQGTLTGPSQDGQYLVYVNGVAWNYTQATACPTPTPTPSTTSPTPSPSTSTGLTCGVVILINGVECPVCDKPKPACADTGTPTLSTTKPSPSLSTSNSSSPVASSSSALPSTSHSAPVPSVSTTAPPLASTGAPTGSLLSIAGLVLLAGMVMTYFGTHRKYSPRH